jgi:hypothetical protein
LLPLHCSVFSFKGTRITVLYSRGSSDNFQTEVTDRCLSAKKFHKKSDVNFVLSRNSEISVTLRSAEVMFKELCSLGDCKYRRCQHLLGQEI